MRAGSNLVVGVSLAVVAAGCGGDAPGELVFSHEALTFADVDPSAGPRTQELEIENVGGAQVLVYEARVVTEESVCGTFALGVQPPWRPIQAGATWRVPVTFEPDPACEPGCGCAASARLMMSFDVGGLQVQIPLIARGTCDLPLACSPTNVELPDAVVESTYVTNVTCYNVTDAAVTVAALEVEGSEPGVVTTSDAGTLPRELAVGSRFRFTVSATPSGEGDFDAMISVAGAGGVALAEVFVAGTAHRLRPLCSSELPVDPEPVLETEDYTIVLESPTPSSYTGVVRSFWFYTDQPPLIADVLVTSGAFADPACIVGQSGHMAHWEGEACLGDPDDLFVNVHALPHSEIVDGWVRSLEEWDTVTVRGYEVDRINYTDGSWWTDAGCHTLIITLICDTEAP
jgi:hypothetical protein